MREVSASPEIFMTDETGTAPATADTAPAVTQTPEAPAEQATTAPADAEPKPAAEPKKVDPRQRKIAELSYRLREQDRRIDQLIGLSDKQVQSRQSAQEDEPPRIEKFSTIDEYVDAKLEYREKQKQAKAPEPARQDHSQAVNAAAQELVMSGSDKYEDFEEVVFAPNVQITPYMADAILNLDEPDMKAEVAYYLAKNQKEALQISRLAPSRQAAEIGKLEMKLSSKPEPQKKPSSAPEPIAPVNAGRNVNDTTLKDSDDIKTWLKNRNKLMGRPNT
jgi:hypothetical protein